MLLPVKFHRAIFAAPLLLLCGCSDTTDLRAYPPPGAMTIVSVEPVEIASTAVSLVKNADFSEWWAGAPAPEGFNVPAADLSSIERLPHPWGNGQAARQIWKVGDKDKGLKQMFHLDLGELEAHQTYVFIVDAVFVGGANVELNLWEMAPEKREKLEPPFILLTPSTGVMKRYIKKFTPTFGGQFVLSANAPGASVVDWLRWEVLPEWAAS